MENKVFIFKYRLRWWISFKITITVELFGGKVNAAGPFYSKEEAMQAAKQFEREIVFCCVCNNYLLKCSELGNVYETYEEVEDEMNEENVNKADKYIKRIGQSKTRFEAADLLRAYGCHLVVTSYNSSPEENVTILERIERNAQSLESDFFDDLHAGTEAKHPWRSWLVDWGFLEKNGNNE